MVATAEKHLPFSGRSQGLELDVKIDRGRSASTKKCEQLIAELILLSVPKKTVVQISADHYIDFGFWISCYIYTTYRPCQALSIDKRAQPCFFASFLLY